MRILQVSAEIFPLLKTGGLADVAGALPLALLAAGQDVRVLLPGFPAIVAGVVDAQPVAEFAAPWGERRPAVPDGYTITAIATGLAIPRQTLVLPNGDILVAEGRGGSAAPKLRPKDIVAGRIKAKGTSPVKSGNRLTLLRDADGDGVAEVRTAYLTGLTSPFGMAVVGNTLYVANADALVAFPYDPGATAITAAPRVVARLPAGRSTIVTLVPAEAK